jgi:ATP-dependent Clp protease adaptor protein ClpS
MPRRKSQHEPGVAVATKPQEKLQKPPLYRVLLHNDDYTTMEFVVHVLETVFLKSPAEAHRITMHVHQNGHGVAGIYPWEVAETKADRVSALAGAAGYPLRATLEEA